MTGIRSYVDFSVCTQLLGRPEPWHGDLDKIEAECWLPGFSSCAVQRASPSSWTESPSTFCAVQHSVTHSWEKQWFFLKLKPLWLDVAEDAGFCLEWSLAASFLSKCLHFAQKHLFLMLDFCSVVRCLWCLHLCEPSPCFMFSIYSRAVPAAPAATGTHAAAAACANSAAASK